MAWKLEMKGKSTLPRDIMEAIFARRLPKVMICLPYVVDGHMKSGVTFAIEHQERDQVSGDGFLKGKAKPGFRGPELPFRVDFTGKALLEEDVVISYEIFENAPA